MAAHLIVAPWAEPHLVAVTARLDAGGIEWSSDVGHDTATLARAALEAGRTTLIALGDDGTLHGVVRGVMGSAGPRVEGTTIGILPAAASGVARTFGIPSDPVGACRVLIGEERYDLDVGIVRCADQEQGHPFIAIAEVGFGARAGRSTGGGLRSFLSFWSGLASSGDTVAVQVGRRGYEGAAWDVVVGNCQFIGDLRLSPRSFPGDGVLDVLVMTGTRANAFRRLPQMYRGEHVPDDEIHEFRGTTVRIDSKRHPIPVHADGVPVGVTPATFEIIPQALQLLV